MIRSTYSYTRHHSNSRESVLEALYDPFRERVFPRPQPFSFNSEYYQHPHFRRIQLCRHRRGCSVLKYTSKWRIAREKNAFEEDERMVHHMPSWKKYASYEEDQKFYGDMAQQIKSLTNDGEINRFEEEEDIFSRQVKEYIYELSPERKVSKFDTNFNNHSSNISTLYNVKTNQNPRSSEYEDISNNDQRSDYNYRETIRDRVKTGSKRNLYEKHNEGLKPRYKMENIFNESYKLSQREGAKTRWNEDSNICKLERNEKSISREHDNRTMNENINNSHCSYKNTKTQHHSHYGVTTPRYYNKGMDRYESNYSVRDRWQNETRDLHREYRAAESNGSRETFRSLYREITKLKGKHLERYRDEASVDYENTREETYHYKEGKDSRETEKFRPKEIENMSNKNICQRGRRPMKEEEKPSSEWKNKRPIREIKKCHGIKHHSREMINYKSNQEKESKWRDKDKNHETQIRCPVIRKIETHNKIGSVYLDEDTNNIKKELHESLWHRVNIRSYSSVGSKIQDLRIRSHTSVGRGSRNNIISRSRRNARSSSYERTDNKPLRNERNYNTIETTSSSKIGSANKSDKWGSRENKKWSSKESVKRRSSERGKRWSSESSESSPSKRGKRWSSESSESSPSKRGKSSPSERGKRWSSESSPSERGKSSSSESSLSGRSSSERTKSGSRGRGSCSDEESSSSASVKSRSRDRIQSSQGKQKNKYHCARRELREKYVKSCQRKKRKDKTKSYCEKKNSLQDNKIMSCNVIKSTCLDHVLESNDDKRKSPCDGLTDKLCSKVRRGFHHSQGRSTREGFDDKKSTPDKLMTSKAHNTTQISVHCRTAVLGRDKKRKQTREIKSSIFRAPGKIKKC